MIPNGDLDLTTYLNELLRTNNPDHQNNTFWFPTTKNTDKTGNHTPIGTRIGRQLRELKEKRKLNPHDNTESRLNFLEQFHWKDTLLRELEKQAIENFLVD